MDRLHVHREEAVELLLGHLGHRLVAMGGPGVVHQHVEAAIAIEGGTHHGRDIAAPGDVGLQADRRAASAVDLGGHCRCRLAVDVGEHPAAARSEEHTSELQSLMRISYAVFCLKKQKKKS